MSKVIGILVTVLCSVFVLSCESQYEFEDKFREKPKVSDEELESLTKQLIADPIPNEYYHIRFQKELRLTCLDGVTYYMGAFVVGTQGFGFLAPKFNQDGSLDTCGD